MLCWAAADLGEGGPLDGDTASAVTVAVTETDSEGSTSLGIVDGVADFAITTTWSQPG